MSNIETKKNYNKNNTTISQNSKNDTKEDDILLLPEYVPPLTRTCGIYQSCNGNKPCGSTRCYLLTIER